MKTTHCKICGKEIPIYNITDSCKSCFNSFARKKNKNGDWVVSRHWLCESERKKWEVRR